MKKFKKVISLVAALAMSVSAFAGLTANAAVGDVLMEQNFDAASDGTTEPWGQPSRTDKASVEYPLVEALAEDVSTNKPDTVSGNLFNFKTTAGQNINVKYNIDPTVSAADVYNVTFDMFVKNGIYGTGAEETGVAENYQYIFGLGTSDVDGSGNATATNMVEFRVEGSNFYYISNGDKLDTGIDLGNVGKWIKVNVTCDVQNHKFSGTLTSTVGDECKITTTDFANINSAGIAQWYVQSVRFSGSEKGYVNNYLDNFVVTEAEAEKFADVTINYVDSANNSIKDAYIDSAVVGSAYNVADLHKDIIPSDDSTKYYEYVSGAEEITVAEEGNEVTLVFELKDKLAYEVYAINKDFETIEVVASGLVIPGEKVKAYGDFAILKDGVAYVPESETGVTFEPTAAAQNASIMYVKAESSNAAYDFENDVVGFNVNNEAAAVAIADSTDAVVNSNVNGEKALKFTSTNATTGAIRTASLNVNPYTANHATVVVNYDAYITNSGRMTLNLLNAPISAYGDTGLFSIGVKDSGGFRVNGIQNNGVNTWVHISVKADFANDKLYYTVTDSLTGKLITSTSKEITSDVLETISFISWLDASAYIDNIEVISTDRIIPDAEYTFEEDTESPFANNDHTASAVVDATDEAAAAVIDASLNGNKVLKFTADGETGESKQAVAMLDISEAALGATEVTVNYDSYVNSNNVYFGIASDSVSGSDDKDILFSHGYRSSKGYYVVYGESGSAYTGANGKWVHTKLVYNCDTGALNYAITSPDGLTTYKSGSATYDANAVKKVYVLSWGADSVGYIDNIVVTTKKNEVLDFEDGVTVFTPDENSTADVVDTTDAVVNANINGSMAVKFTSAEGVGDKIKKAEAVYDISAQTAGKAKVIVSYDSYVAEGMRTTINVGDFSQGYGSQSYYIINGATGSAYTAAAGQWVRTVLEYDLNAGKYTYTVSSLADDSVYVTKTLDTDLASVDSIKFVSATANDAAYIDNISVTGLGTYVAPPFPKAELSYDAATKTVTATTTDAQATSAVIIVATKADGVVTAIKSYALTYAEGTASQVLDAELTENDTVYLWSTLDGGMTPTAETYTVSAAATPDEA